jgi:hypothetical protein
VRESCATDGEKRGTMATTSFCQLAVLNVRFSSFGFWVLDVLIRLGSRLH